VKPEVWFEDEAYFGRMSNPVPCWAPRKTRPLLPMQRQKQCRSVYGAVNPLTGGVFEMTAGRNNSETTGEFLRALSASRGGARMLVFLDGAGWHKAKGLAVPANARLEILPPYSPELNPSEHLWKHIRTHHTHNRAWESLEEIDTALREAFASLKDNPQTVKSFSLFDWMVYD